MGAIIVDKDGKILVAQRPYSDISYKSYIWEFPGGKVEEQETPQEALKREIKEELDCEIIVEEKIGEINHEYPDFQLNLSLFLCRLKDNSRPKALEHNQIKWIRMEESDTLDWIEADYEILPLINKIINQRENIGS